MPCKPKTLSAANPETGDTAMLRGRMVAILQEGVRGIHALDSTGNSATLCGMDGNDPHWSTRQSSGGAVRRGEKIDCEQCRMVWETARKYRASDFAAYAKKRTR